MDKKSVLILCYTFPPKAGIGGRRWAKFGKYLFRKGIDVHILTQMPENSLATSQHSEWTKDTLGFQENISYFNIPFPKIINKKKYNLVEKTLYRVVLKYLQFAIRGNFYDRTSFSNRQFLLQIKEYVIKHNIKNLIVSAGPFTWLTFIIKLKKDLPSVNFIADFRDPWCDNKQSFGYAELSKNRFRHELTLEKKVIEKFDKIISVSNEMNEYFFSVANVEKEKFSTIANGFDREDYPLNTSRSNNEKKELKFIYAGTLYDKSGNAFLELVNSLDILKNENLSIYNSLKFDFYGTVPAYFFDGEQKHSNINFYGSLPLDQIFEKIQDAEIGIVFLTKGLEYAFSTKLLELFLMNKTVALFSEKGSVSDFIEKNDLGYLLSEGTIYEKLKEIHYDWSKGRLKINPGFDTSAFDIEELTKKLMRLLI